MLQELDLKNPIEKDKDDMPGMYKVIPSIDKVFFRKSIVRSRKLNKKRKNKKNSIKNNKSKFNNNNE